MESPVPARSMPPPPPPKPHKSPILNGGGADKGHIYTNINNNNGPILPQNGKSSLTAPFSASNPSAPPEDEQVVMTPRGKTANSTVLLIERKLVQQVGDRTHVAGGDHRGIIINKDTSTGEAFGEQFFLYSILILILIKCSLYTYHSVFFCKKVQTISKLKVYANI